MTIDEFYEFIENNSELTKDDIDNMYLDELYLFCKINFNKSIKITFVDK